MNGDANSPAAPASELELETPYPLDETERKDPIRKVLALPPSPGSQSPAVEKPPPTWIAGLGGMRVNRTGVVRSVKSMVLVGKVRAKPHSLHNLLTTIQGHVDVLALPVRPPRSSSHGDAGHTRG